MSDLSSGLDEDDYDEMDEEVNNEGHQNFQYGFSLPGDEEYEQ